MVKAEKYIEVPKGDIYDPGAQVKKAKEKTETPTTKKIVENIL